MMKIIKYKNIRFFKLVCFMLLVHFSSGCAANDLSLTLSNIYLDNSYVVEVALENTSNKEIVVPLLFIPEDYYIRFNIRERDSEKHLRFSGTKYDWIESEKDYLRIYPTSKYSQKLNLESFYNLETDKCYVADAIYEVAEYQRKENFLWLGKVKSNEIELNCSSMK